MKKVYTWLIGIMIGVAVAFFVYLISVIFSLFNFKLFYTFYSGPVESGVDYSSLARPTPLGLVVIFGSGLLVVYLFIRSRLKRMKR